MSCITAGILPYNLKYKEQKYKLYIYIIIVVCFNTFLETGI